MKYYFQSLLGDSVSQWWQWQGGSRDSTPAASRQVMRSSSLKGNLNHDDLDDEDEDEDDDDDGEVFVTADPIRAKQSHQVKSAMIVSAYCTTARASTVKSRYRIKQKKSPSKNMPRYTHNSEFCFSRSKKRVTIDTSDLSLIHI